MMLIAISPQMRADDDIYASSLANGHYYYIVAHWDHKSLITKTVDGTDFLYKKDDFKEPTQTSDLDLAQMFYVTKSTDDDNAYYIQNVSTGKYIGAYNSAGTEGTTLAFTISRDTPYNNYIYPWTSSPNSVDKGTYGENTFVLFDNPGASNEWSGRWVGNGYNVHSDLNDAVAHAFHFYDVTTLYNEYKTTQGYVTTNDIIDGYYYIVANFDNRTLTVSNGNLCKAGTFSEPSSSDNINPSQVFHVVNTGVNTYSIQNMRTNKYVGAFRTNGNWITVDGQQAEEGDFSADNDSPYNNYIYPMSSSPNSYDAVAGTNTFVVFDNLKTDVDTCHEWSGRWTNDNIYYRPQDNQGHAVKFYNVTALYNEYETSSHYIGTTYITDGYYYIVTEWDNHELYVNADACGELSTANGKDYLGKSNSNSFGSDAQFVAPTSASDLDFAKIFYIKKTPTSSNTYSIQNMKTGKYVGAFDSNNTTNSDGAEEGAFSAYNDIPYDNYIYPWSNSPNSVDNGTYGTNTFVVFDNSTSTHEWSGRYNAKNIINRLNDRVSHAVKFYDVSALIAGMATFTDNNGTITASGTVSAFALKKHLDSTKVYSLVDLSNATLASDVTAGNLSNLIEGTNALITVPSTSTITGINIINNNSCEEFKLTDRKSFVAPTTDFTAKSVTYTRNMTTDWGTVYLPYDATPNSEIEFFELKDVGTNVVTVESVNMLKANTPALIHKVGSSTTISLGLTSYVTITGNIDSYSDSKQGELIGSYKRKSVVTDASGQYNYYYLNGDEFHVINKYFYVIPFRAYLSASGTASLSPSFKISIDDDPTGITGVATGETDNEIESVYSVSGVKQSTLQKGINIVRYRNGKTQKVILK